MTPLRTTLLGVLFAATALGACSESVDDATTSTSSVTTTSIATTTIATLPPTITTPAPTTATTEDPETAIREIHTRFMVDLYTIDERVDPIEEHLALAEELTSGVQLQRLIDGANSRVERGIAMVFEGYDSNIIGLTIDDQVAYVEDCSRDASKGYSRATGELVVPADDFFKIRTTEIQQSDGIWKVSNFFAGGDQRCNPN